MSSKKINKILFSFVVLGIIAYQFIFMFIIWGKPNEFLGTLESFGIEQTLWSKFVFDTAEFWRWLLVIEFGLLGYTLKNFQSKFVLLTVVLNLFGILALLWALYDPNMRISLNALNINKNDSTSLKYE